MSIPSTIIWICSGVPLTNRYDHTLYFSSIGEQNEYFNSKVSKTLMTYSYVRRTWKLKVQSHLEEARMWSYLFFKNGTSGKRYYYFINEAEYINDNTVELSLELDVLQTYLFDWTLRPCYVEREHSETDIIGDNTVDEGLDVGEYLVMKKEIIDLNSDLNVMIASSIDLPKYLLTRAANVTPENPDPDGEKDPIAGARFDKIYGGFQVCSISVNYARDLAGALLTLNKKGLIDSVFAMWMYPRKLVEFDYGSTGAEWFYLEYVTASKTINFNSTHTPETLDGYKPKNKKVLQYPYCFIYATNNNGGAAVYPYEYFGMGSRFIVEGNIAPDAVVRLTPVDYKGQLINYDESLVMGGYPLCSWNSDSYKMWLAQNQNQHNFGLAMSGLKILGGAAAIVGGVAATGGTGGAAGALGFAGVSSGVGMLSSGVTEIAGQLAQRADREIQPPQARGTIAGSHNVARGLQNFDLYHKSIDAYHAEMIDNYFTMYGYACRKVKTPNINSRPAFNYVKTVGSNITGDFAMEDVKLINTIFDKGVTFWKNPANVGNYNLDNAP